MIIQYRTLIGWRYDQLMKMEKELKNSYKMYIREWEDFFKHEKEKEKFSFSRLEIFLPKLFMGLYVVYGLGLVIATRLK